MASSIQGIDRLFARVKKLAQDTRQVERPLKVASVYMLGSIDKNFADEGRPQKWKALADSTKAKRRGSSPKILTDRAKLRRSHSFNLTNQGSEIGTNAVQGPRQHFGYSEGEGRGQAETPARPFLMFQREDIREIGEIFKRSIAGK
jgi:phage virion morphogenesis protein